ncbi:MAG: glutamate--tRNA ligase [Candidatus Marinimicrobia bacterium]|jgi:glutamyl-tRNA synthetase|nr:glutamate--tRNA ligase [Candidatus Neomarinimicrobiota bacterium]MBT3675876.1 glutamate--tRNA ligase [Candidatus Neomarinimicrobiota bacterium]MBT3763475.1 glutamate--tRNA ligase [Candidatus Neomarinimicrobiota bacterium]MBT4068563.1 glutamate--tRNA ligase [Candidatus Neomarinimicrobiota bacterium]MBT4271571.1 glutamate--tRNA ligase [Candidatus Neomarinimicrobiota bacterium]
MSNSSVKVRFAPSPTGELHIGGARTALFNWLFARNNGGKFYLRIEDTDPTRSQDKFTDQILESLAWLGLDWDGPLVYQSKRFDDYKIHVKALLGSGQVYRCFCSKDDLQSARDKGHYQYPKTCRNLTEDQVKQKLNQGVGFTYRVRIPDGETNYEDLIYGPIRVDHKELDDFIVVRSDGSPTYNFTAVIDDYDMGITHVIRGEDHVANTPKQILLYEALGYEIPTFAHLPMILGHDKKRLSKRHGAPGVQNFRDDGYFPEILLNYLALLGWNPGTEEELFSVAQLIEKFDLSLVHKKGAVWDEKKLHWLSGQYIKNQTSDSLLESIRGINPDWGKGSEISFLISILELLKVRAKSLNEFVQQSEYFFNDPASYDEKGVKKGWKDESVNLRINEFLVYLVEIPNWRKEEIETVFKTFAETKELGLGKIIMPVRLATCGTLNGPSIFQILELLGKDITIRRIKTAKEKLPS